MSDDGDTVGEMKRKRSNAMATFTRSTKAIQKMLEGEASSEILDPLVKKMTAAFEKL